MGKKIGLVLLVVFIALSLTLALPARPAQAAFLEEAKLTGENEVNAYFGCSVAISGDTAVVGVHGDDIFFVGENTGSAYVFVRSGTTWTQQQKLLAGDGAGYDEFGISVAISGDTIVVGAPYDDDLYSRSGSAYVFVRNAGAWSEQQKLTASDAAFQDDFGRSVAISGDTIVVGANGDDGDGDLVNDSGSAYVFVRSGSTWTEQQKLTASDGAEWDCFGYSAGISGDTAVVGAYPLYGSSTSSDSAYVFVRSGSTWTEQQKLTASDRAAGDAFGMSVAISGDTIAVGANGDDDMGSASGSAYVFARSGSTWTEQPKLNASDGSEYDHFGYSVAIDGDTLVVGADQDDDNGTYSGSAYVLVRSGGVWSEDAKLLASDGATGDHFGNSVAISGDTIVAGAEEDDGIYSMYSRAGSAYVYGPEPPTLSLNDVTVVEGNSGTSNAEFTVTLSDPSSQAVTVDYATADGTASAGADYQTTSETLTFAVGQTTKTITVPVLGDTLDEADETFSVNLSNPTNATIADSQGVGTIQDDDPLPALSINNVTVMEGNSGTNNAEFIVTLSDPSSQAVTVDYATADGTATAGTDYQATGGTLTFPPGQTMRPIAVPVLGDTLDEPDETFSVNLSNPTNATIADSQGVGTIQDDDIPPVTFPDDNLEALIREVTGIPTGDIYPADLLPLTTLDGHGRGIIDLSGLEYCVNLTSLQLGDNQVSNIQPLVDNAGLASGDSVDLTNNPLSLHSIKDLIPLLEARGVTVSYTSPDSDGDGIYDIVDVDPGNSSAEFSDGTTSGSVVSLDPGITIWITDASDPADGIEVVVSGPEDSSAVLSVAGGAVEITLNGNDDIIVTSTRIEVVVGSVDVTFKATDGSTATTTLDAGNDVTFDPDAFSITNNGTETATIIVNGQEYSIAPGETSFISGVSPPITVLLLNSTSTGIPGGLVKYYDGGWQDFGTTDVNGEVQKSLPLQSYKFRMTYAGAYNDKTQNVGVDPVVVFQTTIVTVQLQDSVGNLIDTGEVKYSAGGWNDFGSTSGGQVSKELLPKQYKFRMTYAGTYIDKYQDVGANPTVVFQTVNVTVQLRDSIGNLIGTGKVMYSAGGWKDFGTTSGGQVSKELLPKQYKFRMTYAGAHNDKTQDVGVDLIVVFQTGQVVSDSGACTHYYAGGWQEFTSGMELLPNTYKFRFNDGTPNTTYTITSGIVNNIH